MPTALQSIIPKTLGVRFRTRRGGTSLPHTNVPIYSYAVNGAGSVLTQSSSNTPYVIYNFDTSYLFSLIAPAGADLPAGVGGTLVLRDTALALYDPSQMVPYTNLTNLAALAKQIAVDWLAWRLQAVDDNDNGAFDQVYNGVIDPTPSGALDSIEWTYTHFDQSTRVKSPAWGGDPREFQHQDGTVGSATWQGWDRTPGVLQDIPGAASGFSYSGLLTLERGRLFSKYDHTNTLNCGCGSSSVPTDGFCFPNPGPATLNLTCTYPASPGPTIIVGDGAGGGVNLGVDGSGSFSDTLTFSATKPASFPPYVDNNVYIGSGSYTASFVDYIGTTHTGVSVRLAFICDGSGNPVSGDFCVAVFTGGINEGADLFAQSKGQIGNMHSPPTASLVQYKRNSNTLICTVFS